MSAPLGNATAPVVRLPLMKPGEHQAYACVAERFKTKACRNFMTQGVCQYEQKCMFAHGEHELRTKEMNMAEGITSEVAVKKFRKAQSKLRRAEAGEGSADVAAAAAAAATAQGTVAGASPVVVVTSPAMQRPKFQSVLHETAGESGAPAPTGMVFSHNPYSWDSSVTSHNSSVMSRSTHSVRAGDACGAATSSSPLNRSGIAEAVADADDAFGDAEPLTAVEQLQQAFNAGRSR